MNKDSVIRNLKYEKEKHKNDKVDTFGTDISMMCTDILGLLENCIEIPYGATNGDMMIAMFPNLKVEIEGIHITCWIDEHRWFAPDYDWWNLPYKKEVE